MTRACSLLTALPARPDNFPEQISFFGVQHFVAQEDEFFPQKPAEDAPPNDAPPAEDGLTVTT